jgi:hypothetical protein
MNHISVLCMKYQIRSMVANSADLRAKRIAQ